MTAVLSHGWLAPGHPDPAGKRREDVKTIRVAFLFWDFLSLLQAPRSAAEQESFLISLGSMHTVYAPPADYEMGIRGAGSGVVRVRLELIWQIGGSSRPHRSTRQGVLLDPASDESSVAHLGKVFDRFPR